eukprot:8730848-Alexandrium_andersonii.AAC.1
MTGLAEVAASAGPAGHNDVPLEDQIVPLRPDLLLHGCKALMAALKRWWRRWRSARWCNDEVEEFLRRRAGGQ